MADEDDGAASAGHVAHFAKAFLLKIDVSDSQDFIHEKNFRLEIRSNGKREAHVHSGRVVLCGRVNKFLKLGEGNDLVELAGDLLLAHAQDGAGEEGVFAASELGMEASADFEEGTDAAVNFRPASRGTSDAGENLEEGGFARAVAADDTEDFAFAHFEPHVFQGPEGLVFGAAEDGERRFQSAAEMITEERALLNSAAMVALAEPFTTNHNCVHHSNSVGNGGLHPIEEKEPAEDDEREGGGRNEKDEVGRLAVAGDGPSEAVNDAGHGVETVQPAPMLRNERTGIRDRRGEHPELNDKGDDVAHIAIKSVERGHPEADAESGEKGEKQQGGEP